MTFRVDLPRAIFGVLFFAIFALINSAAALSLIDPRLLGDPRVVRNQFQVSCFPGCRCNRTVIECRDLGERTTELFRHIRPDIYPDLDTLIVVGNQFGDLPNENIFGADFRHKRLNFVNISNNGIRSFGAQTFIGIPRVEYFYLDNNRLNDVADDQPFNYFTSLKLLSLRAVFGHHISVNARAEMIHRMLHSSHSFIDLKEIVLSNNRIDHLHIETFCDVKGLTQLYLKDNQLAAFEFRAGCLNEVRMLDLAGNRLTRIEPRLWKGQPSLDTLDVSRNPLICDCQLEAFHKFAVEEVNTFLNQETTTCAAPKQLAGKRLFALPDDADLCIYGERAHLGLGRWLLLTLAGVGLLLCYRFCRDHGHGFSDWREFGGLRRKESSASQMRVPLVSDGYSQLKSMDEGGGAAFVSNGGGGGMPPPAFV